MFFHLQIFSNYCANLRGGSIQVKISSTPIFRTKTCGANAAKKGSKENSGNIALPIDGHSAQPAAFDVRKRKQRKRWKT